MRADVVNWEAVESERVSAIAYDPETETIYVRFRDGAEWQYAECPPHVWEEFSAPTTSKGRFIHDVLDAHPKGPV